MKVYCTRCRKRTEHKVNYHDTGNLDTAEYVATCACAHFVKFPGVGSAEELEEHADAHERENINAPRALTDEEIEAMNQVPEHAAAIIAQVDKK